MKTFHSSVTDLRETFGTSIVSFGYECGWADEAIFFVTSEDTTPAPARIDLQVQLSADGIRWLDEGTRLTLTGPSASFVRVSGFGGFLRLAGTLEDADTCTLTIRLALKG